MRRPQRIPGLLYTSPYVFSIRQRLNLCLLPLGAALGLKALIGACRIDVRGIDHWNQVLEAHGRVIVAIWHESMGLAAAHYRNTGFHTLTSYSFDGEFAARVVKRFGLLALRGSSSRGGSDALDNMAEALHHVQAVGFTLDGPRGPRRVAKPGIAILAARTATPIIPHAFAVHPAWRLHSWDRFPIPKPFARIISAYGPAIPPPESNSPDAAEVTRRCVEETLNRLHDEIESELP